MPQDAAYRKYTEQLIKDRLKHVETVRTPAGRAPVRAPRIKCWKSDTVCSQEPDVQKLEEKINCGQIEEVIFQASWQWLHSFVLAVILRGRFLDTSSVDPSHISHVVLLPLGLCASSTS